MDKINISRYFLLNYNSSTVQQGYREKSIIEKEEIPTPLLTGGPIDQNVMQTRMYKIAMKQAVFMEETYVTVARSQKNN